MQNIGEFLKRYLNFTPPALVRSRAVAKAVTELFGVSCTEEDVLIRGSAAFVRGSGAFKSEVSLRKKELLDKVEAFGGGKLEDIT